MEVSKVVEKGQNPQSRAGLLSKFLFLWTFPLISKGFKKGLTFADLTDPRSQDDATKLGNTIQAAWQDQLSGCGFNLKTSRQRPLLFRALCSVYGKEMIKCLLITAIYMLIVQVALPIYLRMLIESLVLSTSGEDDLDLGTAEGVNKGAMAFAGTVCLLTLLQSFLSQYSLHSIRMVGMQCRIGCSALIYRKVLRLSQKSLAEVRVGQVANLLSNDVNKFDEHFNFSTIVILAPIQLLIFTYLLWGLLGPAGLFSFGILLLVLPLEYLIANVSAKYRKRFSEKTDRRGSLMNEVIAGIRIVKMYAFETPFSKLVDDIRKLELNELKKREVLRGVNVALSQMSARLFAYFMFVTFLLVGGQLTSMTVFFTLSTLFVIVRNTVNYSSKGAIGMADVLISTKRIQSFLLLEEQDDRISYPVYQTSPASLHIRLETVSASWREERTNLKNLDVTLEGPKLVFVVGPVGSGKSSLLNLLTAELPISTGRISICGKTSYASQDPWIFAGTLRQNILFGSEMEDDRYKETIRMCSLEQDLLQLPLGDMTAVGERGVILSGGQKARVNLARAVYRKADIYLLDDPMSAVDPRVSQELFENCIRGQELAQSLRILVTHQVQYLPQADYIIVLDHGGILAQGSYKEILNLGLDIEGLLTSASVPQKPGRPSVQNDRDLESDLTLPGQPESDDKREDMARGSVGLKTYYKYFAAAKSPVGLLVTLGSFIIAQVALSGSDYWLSYWTQAEDGMRALREICVYAGELGRPCLDKEQVPHFSQHYLQIYTALLGCAAVACFARVFSYFTICSRISRNLHNGMFSAVIRAPTKFFDDNPSGRILNQFVNDVGGIDELLPTVLTDTLVGGLDLLGVLIIVSLSNVYMIIPTSVLLVGFYFIRSYYLPSARDVKRLEAVARSPLFSHMSATIQGIATVRSAKAQQILVEQFEAHQNVHTSAWFLFMSVGRWLAVWLELLSCFYLTITSFALLTLSNGNEGSYVGLAIYSILTLMIELQWVVRQSAEAENHMTSVQRVLEYSKLTSEAPLESLPHEKPPRGWPTLGAIHFQNVSLSYGSSGPVLKGLTFDIGSGEKVGIVGRTGAGKSSIVSCLFRLVEPTGDIIIDGLRVNNIGLHELRKNISIIPQDPFLFAGTLRYNLDPFGQFGDDELYRSLEDVELKESFPNLEVVVSDGGKNFSVGQRQLICLARAILRQNKIIVLDEATANVDQRTDRLIQSTIGRKFAKCTVITIAHRLNTVIQSDRIMVLDNGYIMEYDRPEILLQNPKGWFTKSLSQTGNSNSD